MCEDWRNKKNLVLKEAYYWYVGSGCGDSTETEPVGD